MHTFTGGLESEATAVFVSSGLGERWVISGKSIGQSNFYEEFEQTNTTTRRRFIYLFA